MPSPCAPVSDDGGDSDAGGDDGGEPESEHLPLDDGHDGNAGEVVTYSPSSSEPNETSPTKSDDEVMESQESVDTIDAPTLVLGEDTAVSEPEPMPATDSDSESESAELTPSSQHRDSQVSSGWLGRAYMYENAKARKEAQKRRVADGIECMVRSIKCDLETALKQDLDGDLWSGYATWSYKALKDYGDHVYGHLACPQTYQHWVRDQKAEDWF